MYGSAPAWCFPQGIIVMFQKFLGLPRFYKRLISVSADVVALLFSLWAAFSLRFEQQFWLPNQEQLVIAGLTVAFTIGVFVRLGLYRAVVRYLNDRAFLTVVGGVTASALMLIFLGYWLEVLVPRSVPIIYAAFAFIFVSGSRMGIRMLVSRPVRHSKERVAIIGAGETGLQLCQALDQGTEYQPVAFISFL